MKTKKMRLLTVLTLGLALGLSGCSKDPELITPEATDKGSLVVSFKSSELTTKAMDKSATAAEKTLNTVDVFIYKANKTLEKQVTFTLTDFDEDQVVADKYTLKDGKKIDGLETGAKSIYLGINLPSTLTTLIKEKGAEGMTSYYAASLQDLTGSGFVMFSNKGTATIVANQTVAPDDAFDVTRVVAKASVKTKANISKKVAGGVISGITYAVQNINQQFYPVAPTAPVNNINQAIPTSYIEVENVLASGHDTKHSYMPEHVPSNPLAGEYPTYIRIQCDFTPDAYIDDATNETTTTTGNANGDFWTLPLTTGTVAYFTSEATATSYFTIHGDKVEKAGKTNFSDIAVFYEGGKVDYGVFLHKDSNKFNVVRNNYYIVTITGINGLGQPQTTPQIQPKEYGGLISFELQIKEWEQVESDDIQIS